MSLIAFLRTGRFSCKLTSKYIYFRNIHMNYIYSSDSRYIVIGRLSKDSWRKLRRSRELWRRKVWLWRRSSEEKLVKHILTQSHVITSGNILFKVAHYQSHCPYMFPRLHPLTLWWWYDYLKGCYDTYNFYVSCWRLCEWSAQCHCPIKRANLRNILP